MSVTREQIFQALFTLVSSSSAFVTASRTLVSWEQLSPSGQMPAIYVRQMKEDSVVTRGLPTVSKMHAEIYIYCATEKHSGPGSTVINGLVDAVTAALAPDAASGEQTLGGLVHRCRIEGGTVIDEGTLGDVAMAMLPVEIIGFPIGPSTGIGGPVATVTVNPSSVNIAALANQQLAVTLKDAALNVLVGRQITYVSENPAICTVNASGVVIGVAAGSCFVYVVSEGVQANVPVTVTAGAWTPPQSPNLELWLRGDAGITIGTGVSQWADQSGNGRNFTQGTGPKQPLNSNTLNGLAVLTFQRANSQYLQQSAGVNMPSGACSVFVVYRLRTTPGGSQLWNLYHFISDSKIEEAIVFGNGNGFSNMNFLGESGPGTTLLRAIPDAWDTNAHSLSMIFSGKYQANNASFAIRKDETTKVVSANPGGNYGVSGLSISSIGAFRNDLEGQFMDGDIAEILHYSRVLGAGEIANAEAYLTARWGV